MRIGLALAVALLAFGAAFAIARSGDEDEPRTVRGVQPAAAADTPPAIRMPASAGALPPLPKKPKRKPEPSDGPVSSPPAEGETTPEPDPAPSTPTFTPPSNDGGGGGSTPQPRQPDPRPQTPDPPPPPDSDG